MTFLILIICLLDGVLKLRGEFTYWSLLGVKGLNPHLNVHVSCRFFQVIIITYSLEYSGVVNLPESFTPQDLMTYEKAHKSSIPAAYVTFQFRGHDFNKYREFVIGDGAQSNSGTRTKRSSDNKSYYYNKPLQSSTNYRIFLRAFVTEV